MFEVSPEFVLPPGLEVPSVFEVSPEFALPTGLEVPSVFEVSPEFVLPTGLEVPSVFEVSPEFVLPPGLEVPSVFEVSPEFVLPPGLEVPSVFEVSPEFVLPPGLEVPSVFEVSPEFVLPPELVSPELIHSLCGVPGLADASKHPRCTVLGVNAASTLYSMSGRKLKMAELTLLRADKPRAMAVSRLLSSVSISLACATDKRLAPKEEVEILLIFSRPTWNFFKCSCHVQEGNSSSTYSILAQQVFLTPLCRFRHQSYKIEYDVY